MSQYIIGVDSGGTYTDAVIMNAENGEVSASAKSPTTHYDLSLGIGNALNAVMSKAGLAPQKISLVSVSTTLATNALVEGKGAEVGLFVIGYNQRLKVPAVAARYIPGGHDIKGNEEEPLGLEFIVDGLKELHGKVDAWAICGQMAFINPTHEKVAAHAISLTAKTPIFCSHESSTKAGMSERASTAVLNAQLLPVMEQFLKGVNEALSKLEITAPVFVVRGDAKAMDMAQAKRQAATTIASGPAATALFGAFSTKNYQQPIDKPTKEDTEKKEDYDAIVLDVGGTTTDITLIKHGNPIIDTDGLVIGKWETHVEAVEMFTVGIGGDSHVAVKQDKTCSIGPKRVVPVCMVPTLPAPKFWIGPESHSRCIILAPNAEKRKSNLNIKKENRQLASEIICGLAQNGPLTPADIMKQFGLAELTVNELLQGLFKEQIICEAGFTPTDALHALGKLEIGNKLTAKEAATRLGEIRGESADEFARSVLAKAEQKIEETVIQHVTRREVGGQLSSFLASKRAHSLLSVKLSLTVPMIGIGAAAEYILPNVAKSLGTTISFPKRYDVGNALGAALMGHEQEKQSAGEDS